VLGRARGLADVVHQFCEYDVVVDTGKDDPKSCIDQVQARLASRR
jgi:chloramphenicol 3-O phosphotransferase